MGLTSPSCSRGSSPSERCVFALSVSTQLMGLSSALEAHCGQAFGAKQYRMLGVYLQRSVIVLIVAAVPVVFLWLNMAGILIALGEDLDIAQATKSYLYWLLPLLVSYVTHSVRCSS